MSATSQPDSNDHAGSTESEGDAGSTRVPAGGVPDAQPSARAFGAVVLGVLWVAMPPLLGFWLLAEIGTLRAFLQERALLGLAIYVAAFAVTSGLGILPTYAQAILGGWTFGLVWGLPGALAGFAGGSLIGFLVTRLVAADAVQQWIDRHPKWGTVRHAFVDERPLRTLGLVTLIRVPPNSPFALTNLALSSTGVPLPTYLLGTIVGMTPRTAITVALAAGGAATGAEDFPDLKEQLGIWPIVGGVVVMFVAIWFMGRIADKALARATGGSAASGAPVASSE